VAVNGSVIRNGAALAVLCASAVILPARAQAGASITYDIAAQDLGTALTQLAMQSNRQIVFAADLTRGKRAPRLYGPMRVEEALERVLAGSGLTYRIKPEGALVIERAAAGNVGARQSQGGPVSGTTDARPETSGGEIVVTAQKKNDLLRDVPIPVSTIAAQSLADKHQFRLKDYYNRIPGVGMSSDNSGAPIISIRGVAPSSFNNPTVGVMVDDVPFGSSIALGAGLVTPEFDPSDLARIEVLRGPQGTLYGAASMGGLLKYVTVDPSVSRVAGRVEAGISTVNSGNEVGYSVSGALNIPVTGTLAFRVSGSHHGNPGYVDNLLTGEKGVNKDRATGGHLSVLWKPSGRFSLKLSSIYQRSNLSGSPLVFLAPGYGDLQQSFLPGIGLKREFVAYSATANWKLGVFDITSITGYNISTMTTSFDYTFGLGEITAQFYPGDGSTIEKDRYRNRKFTQEIRVAAPVTDHLDMLLGGFRVHDSSPSRSEYIPTDSGGQPLGSFGVFAGRSTYSEWAAFANLTYQFTDRFDLQVGGRGSFMKQDYFNVDSGLYVEQVVGQPSPFVYPPINIHERAFTYLVTPRFRISDATMVYARLASGYRPGGVNPGYFQAPGTPRSFEPDQTQNYEIGIKSSAFRNRLYLEASIYRIDWSKVQLSTSALNLVPYYFNGGQAKSQGFELSAQAKPARGLQVAGWLAWNDAVLARDLPPNATAFGRKGDRLPFGSRFSASGSIDYEAPLGAKASASLGASISYTGSRLGDFQSTPQREIYPAYTTVNLSAGLVVDQWAASLAVNNLFDSRGIVSGGLGTYNPGSFDLIHPRTAIFSISRSF